MYRTNNVKILIVDDNKFCALALRTGIEKFFLKRKKIFNYFYLPQVNPE